MGQVTILGKTGGTVTTNGNVLSSGSWGSYGAIVESPSDKQSEAVASIALSSGNAVVKCINAGSYARMANFLISNGDKVDLTKFSKLVFTCSASGVTGTYSELQVATSSDIPSNDLGNFSTLASYKNMSTSSTTYTVNIGSIDDLYFMFRLQGFTTQAIVTFTDIHFE